MIHWSLTFLAIAAISGFLGFSEAAGAASGIAVVQAGAFLFLSVLMLVLPALDSPNPTPQPMNEIEEKLADLTYENEQWKSHVPLIVEAIGMPAVNMEQPAAIVCGAVAKWVFDRSKAAIETGETKEECRRCVECEGQKHHWMDHYIDDAAGGTSHACKHCSARGDLCPVCDGDGVDPEDSPNLCPECGGEGVCEKSSATGWNRLTLEMHHDRDNDILFDGRMLIEGAAYTHLKVLHEVNAALAPSCGVELSDLERYALLSDVGYLDVLAEERRKPESERLRDIVKRLDNLLSRARSASSDTVGVRIEEGSQLGVAIAVAEAMQERIESAEGLSETPHAAIIWTPYTLTLQLGELTLWDDQNGPCELELEAVWAEFVSHIGQYKIIAEAALAATKGETK